MGIFGKNTRIDNIDEQLAYIMKKYPFDKSIINFGVLGDHDYSIFEANSRDISLLLVIIDTILFLLDTILEN